MKKLYFIIAAVLLMTGCRKSNETATVRIHVNEFNISQGDFENREDPATYNKAKAIVLAFYGSDGTEMYKTTQYKDDPTTFTTFGDFTCNLPVGSFTLVAIAYDFHEGDEFELNNLTSAAYTSNRVRETFCYTQSVEVTSSEIIDLSVSLNRIVTGVTINSTDLRPAEATKIRTTYAKGSKSFNPTTGLATDDDGLVVVNNPSSAIGATISISNMAYLYTDEESMTITIEALDADDNVLITKVVPNVPLQRNRVTTLTGAVYTPGNSTIDIELNTTWLPGVGVDIP